MKPATIIAAAAIAVTAAGCGSTHKPAQASTSTPRASNAALCAKTQSDLLKLEADLNQYMASAASAVVLNEPQSGPGRATVETDVTAASGDIVGLQAKATTPSDRARLSDMASSFGLVDAAMGDGHYRDILVATIGKVASQNLAVCRG